MSSTPVIAAIVPCYNEEATVAKVVTDLMAAVSGIVVHVYDNNSTDRTSDVARQAGALVHVEERKGKGNVVRRAFADVEADIYLLIDGDDTYDAGAAPEMIRTLVDHRLDHVLGCRREAADDTTAYRPGHEAGNRAFNRVVGRLFGQPVTDMLSGYRVFSRRFVKSFPAMSREFEIETELTIHSMALRVPQEEMMVGFRDRPVGSESKLRTFHDGFRILGVIGRLFAHERPFALYGGFALIAFLVSLALGIPVIWDFFQTGEVARFPTAILASSLAVIGCLSAVVGLVLTGVLRTRREIARLAYLQLDPPPASL